MKRIVFEWGHDFRPEYRNLKHIIKQLGDVPIIGLTATALHPKFKKISLKTWICLTRLLLKRPLTGQIYITKYVPKRKYRIGYYSFYQTT
jgi:hypothetical protein